MERQEAIKRLRRFSRVKVGSVYDRLSDKQYEALQALAPGPDGFEYPDISYLTIGELIREAEAQGYAEETDCVVCQNRQECLHFGNMVDGYCSEFKLW